MHLRDEADNAESQKICIICQQSFERGLLTSCGHSYCAECFRYWWQSHRNCPTCKKRLSKNDLHQITYVFKSLIVRNRRQEEADPSASYKPQQLTMQEEGQTNEKAVSVANGKESSAIIYSEIRGNVLDQIKNIDLDGSFGTKIDTIARHIVWIREHDPGAKSIVFSQYRDFLDVLARAFTQFRIDYTGIDRKDGIQKFVSARFRANPMLLSRKTCLASSRPVFHPQIVSSSGLLASRRPC